VTTPELDALLALQDVDTALDRHHHRRAHLPERAELVAIEREAAQAEHDWYEVMAAHDVIAARQAAIEAELAATEDRTAAVNRRLYGGEVRASRELQALAADVDSLKARASVLEDQVLEQMERREPLDTQLAGLSAQLDALAARREAAAQVLAAAESTEDEELAHLDGLRAAAAASVAPELIRTYDRLRASLHGVAVARLVGGRCDGCHLTLPSMELDRIRHLPEGEWATCDQCGRILVRS
jgi:predicted  nucleic acid-binding Zn-ribbon protein